MEGKLSPLSEPKDPSLHYRKNATWAPNRGPSAVQPPAPSTQQRRDPIAAPPPPRRGPASSRCPPGPLAARRESQTRGLSGPARPGFELSSYPTDNPSHLRGGGGGGGGSRVRENPTKWRRPLEPRRDRALSRAPAHARASARRLRPRPPREPADQSRGRWRKPAPPRLPAAPARGRGPLVTVPPVEVSPPSAPG